LLKKDVEFMWLQPHQEAFELIRQILTSLLVVKPFDQKLKTELLTDASRLKGLGYALIQREADGTPRLIQCNSKSLTSAERGYAVIEIEGLVIQYAVEDCRFYLLGHKFTVFTDHRSLEGTFRKNLSEVINPSFLSYRLKLVQYADMEVIWTKGKSHLIADALSRNPILDPPESSSDQMALCYGVQPKDPLLHSIHDAAVSDPVYQSIVTAIERGKSVAKLQKGNPGKNYKSVWDKISVLDEHWQENIFIRQVYRLILQR
jgi:hypothetical protein